MELVVVSADQCQLIVGTDSPLLETTNLWLIFQPFRGGTLTATCSDRNRLVVDTLFNLSPAVNNLARSESEHAGDSLNSPVLKPYA